MNEASQPSTAAEDTGWLDRVLTPRSVAIVGASEDIRAPGGRMFKYMLSYGFAGAIHPVNPNRATVLGVPAFPTVSALPEAVDIAVILVPAEAAIDAIDQCGHKGIRTAMIGSAGFSESGPQGEALQRRLAETAARHGIRLIGPNTNGIVNCRVGFAATFTPALDQEGLKLLDGPAAIVSQSGAIGASLFYDAQRSGLRVGRLFNSGNELDVGIESVIDALLEPASGIDVVLGYVEGLRAPRRFVRVARKAQRLGKRIVLLKAGVSAAGASAAAAHTASLAGEDLVYDDVLRQLGVARARSYTNLLDVGRVLSARRSPLGRRASIASMSGGIGIMLTDALAHAGFALATLSPQVQQRIDPYLPPFLRRQNPLDVGGLPFHDLTRLRALLAELDANPDSDFTVLAVGVFERRQMEIAETIVETARTLAKPLFVQWFGGGERATLRLNGAGVPCFPDAERLVGAIAPVAGGSGAASVGPARHADGFAADAATARAILATARDAGREVLDEVDAKRVLAAYGIEVTAERVVRDAAGVDAALATLRLPAVAKLHCDALVHKARVGGVRLGLESAGAVRAAVTDLLALAQRLGLPEADVVLQEQVPSGAELLLGAKRDATFGMVVTLGIGGVLTEAWDDVSIGLADDIPDAATMLSRLRHRRLLEGAAGRPRVDASLLDPTLARFARLVLDCDEWLDAIDVNPIIVHDTARPPVAVDAVFFLKRGR